MSGTLFSTNQFIHNYFKCIDKGTQKRPPSKRIYTMLVHLNTLLSYSYIFLEIYFLFLKIACGRLSVPSRIVKGDVIRWC